MLRQFTGETFNLTHGEEHYHYILYHEGYLEFVISRNGIL